jgi:ribose transport system permease protein
MQRVVESTSPHSNEAGKKPALPGPENKGPTARGALAAAMRLLAGTSVVLAFAIIVLVSSLLAWDSFLTRSNIINILRQVSIVGTISLGMTMIIISGGIDLSVGSALVLVGAADIFVMNLTGSMLLGLLAAVVSGLGIGFINGLIITRGRVTPFIATLGMMATCRSLALYLLDGGGISARLPGYQNIANAKLFGVSFPVYYFVLLTIVVYVFSRKTRLGRYMFALGSNERAAHLSAIDVPKVKVLTYMLGGLLVACAAIIETSRLNSVSAASSGMNYELDAIAAVIIGGTRMSGGRGSVLGTFFGVLILGMLNNMLTLMSVSPFLAGTVKGLIIVVSVMVQKKE